MRNLLGTKVLIAVVAAIAGATIAVMITRPVQPALTKLVNTTPIGENSAVYEVLSDSGGATVGFTYLYFLAAQEPDEAKALQMLEDQSAFLVTRQSGAISKVTGLVVDARVQDRVYQFHSLGVLREQGKVLPVRINLTVVQP